MVLTIWRVKGNKNQKSESEPSLYENKKEPAEIPAPAENKNSAFKSFINWLTE